MGAFRFACVALLLAFAVEAQNITRVAGAGGTVYNGDDPAQNALTANINFPGAAAVDSAGNLYIAEGSGARIRKVTPAGVITTYHGTGTAGNLSTQLSNPSGVAIDAAGNLYIADSGNHRIQKVAAGTMIVTTVAGTGLMGTGADGPATASALRAPVGVAVDGAGDLYLSDSNNHRVRKVTFSTGNIATIAGIGAAACSASTLFLPRGVAVAANGDVYIADTANNNVRKLSGGVMTVAAGTSNFGSGCPSGFVDGTAENARFTGPTGVAVMPNGDVLVSDAGNRRVRRIRSGSVSTLVGDGVDGSTGDNGPASAARLSQAYGIAAGVAGTYSYYIADTFNNNRIRKVVPVAPAAPTLDSATSGSGQVSLAFTPSANDGGAPAASFNASCTPGPVSQGGVASPIVVTGLANGTQYTCSVTATNVAGASVASNTLMVTPGIAPSITSAAPAGGTVGVAYSHTYTATGSPAPSFALTSGALPAGVMLSGSSLTGTPTTAGLFTGTVTASNNVAPTSQQAFSITIAQGSQAITFAPLPDRVLGTGPFTLSATGGASGNAVTFASTTTGTCTATGTNGTTLTLVAAGTCTITADQAGNANYAAAPQVPRSFTITLLQPGLSLSAPTIDFGGQSMGTTSPARTVTVTNTGQAALTVSGLTAPNVQFAYSHDCTNVAASATCTITATFTPAATGAVFNSSTPVSTNLSIASNAAGSPHALALAGAAEKSLVTHYYRSILRRDPDAGGKTYWAGEADRLAALGANPNEAWFAMSAAFYFSAEYLALNTTPTGYVTDLYNTFFNRGPDSGGLNYWVGQMASDMPREVALVSFMFSIEFGNFTQAIFGNTAVRPEIDAVMDFYRGLLSRLPDSGGFNFWAGRFRAAQCQGAAAVTAEADSISSQFALSPEYGARGRTNSQFVGDLYNAFLRRGGDLGGVQFWIGQLDSGAQTREQVRAQFRNSPEFGARVGAIISAGCQP